MKFSPIYVFFRTIFRLFEAFFDVKYISYISDKKYKGDINVDDKNDVATKTSTTRTTWRQKVGDKTYGDKKSGDKSSGPRLPFYFSTCRAKSVGWTLN